MFSIPLWLQECWFTLFHAFQDLCRIWLQSLRLMVLEGAEFWCFCTFQDLCADNLCYQWCAYIVHIILSILSLCRSVSTSLLPCNNYNDGGGGNIDPLMK